MVESNSTSTATPRYVEAQTLSFLRRLTDAIFNHPAPEQIIQTVQRLLGEHLQASRVFVATASEDGETVTVTQTWSVPGVRDLAGVYRLSDYGDRISSDYRSGRTHIRRDTEKEYLPSAELENVRAVQAIAAIDVPVLIEGKLRAVLVVHQKEARNWSVDEITLVQQVADRMVAEVERAKALQNLAATARQHDALLNLQRAVTSAMAATQPGEDSTAAVLKAAADHVLAVIPAATGAVLTTVEHDADGREQLVCRAAAGAQMGHVGFVLPRAGSLSGMCLETGRPLVCDDTETDPRVDLASDRKLGIRSMVVAPISRGSVAVGVLKVASSESHAFVEADTVALRLAIAAISGVLSGAAEARAIDALRRSEMHFRELADAMPQIVFTAKPDGTVDYYNRRWYEYTGFSPGLTGRESWEGVHHPDDSPRVVEEFFNSIRTGTPYEGEQRYRRGSDGIYRWHLVRSVPVRDEHGNIVRWFGASTDIHDYKLLQAERENLLTAEQAARAESERAGRMKDEFLATLSHELRTPLNAIFGWVQILRTPSADSETIKEGLAVIDRNTRAQTRIIEDILDMSRIISGKLRLDVQAVDLATLVQAGVDTVQPAAAAKNVRVTALIDPLASRMSGDPNRLHQVFWNLISNAVKFTPKGGTVKVVLERVNSHVEVSVIDTGEGIAAEFLPFVFDRFRQADSTASRRHGGLGLGLSIVKQLVEMHGGFVSVKSPGIGKGATFTVGLPVSTVQQSHDETPLQREHPAGGVQIGEMSSACDQLEGVDILIVDDEADSRNVLRRLLADCGAILRVAGSAAEAYQLFTEHRPTVCISDIGMPGEDGYSLIRRIRRLPSSEGGHVPAIALTAYARATDRIKAMEAGFQAHLAKPVEPAELIVTVAAIAKMTMRPQR